MMVITEAGEQRTIDRPRAYKLPTLEEARAHFDEHFGGPHNWYMNLETINQDPLHHEPF